jgi:uncharacterized protein (TIGR02996 family)
LKDTLLSLLETWREHRQPEVADLAEGIIAALLAKDPRPPIGATKKAADRSAWREIAAQRDPLDFPRLVSSARGGSQIDVKLQVQYLSGWNHPGLARGLLELLENPPYAGIKSRPMLEEIFEALENSRDVRLVKPARTLAKRYLSIVNSSTGGWIVSELERIAKAIEALSPPDISADERIHYESVGQSLPPEYRPQPKTSENSEAYLEALLVDVYAHPEDDERRLAFAQALQEEDRDRAEFIQLQIGAARDTNTPEQTARLKALGTHARLAGWAQPLSMSGECEFARGFPVAIRLYKTALKSLGEKAWATIERVEAVDGLSQKAAVELLDDASLANIKSVSTISSKVLAALDPRVRSWTALTLSDDTALDKQLLRRVPELRALALNLRSSRATHDPQLLWELGHLKKLTMQMGQTPQGVGPCIPPTVTEAIVHGDLAPGSFSYADKLEKLMHWASRIEKAHLEGLTALKSLDVRAEHFDVDVFEAVPKLGVLKISLPQSNATLPRRIFSPLGRLKVLDLMYARLGPNELEVLQELEELRHHWLNIDAVPTLPRLETFHCMLPRTVDEIERFLARNPTVRHLDFCWNSSSELWFSGDRSPQCERAWEQFGEVLSRSRILSWGGEDKLRVIRQDQGWRLEVKEALYSHDWSFPQLVVKIMKTFGISTQSISPTLYERVKKWF